MLDNVRRYNIMQMKVIMRMVAMHMGDDDGCDATSVKDID